MAANNAGALLATQNLADVGDPAIARTNLGLAALATKGSIADSDVTAGAAISGSKISPNFGAQNVVTTGSVTASSFSGDGSALTNLPVGPLGTSIDSSKIVDNTIVDADINTNAAIAGTKITPNFGAQNVVTTGSMTAASFSGDGSALTNLPAGPLGTSIDSAEIVNDTIVDEDINTNAAIAGTKINPNFGSQNVVTTGNLTGAEVKATSYLQTGTVAGAPAAGDCDAAAEYGRLRVDTTNNRLYVCSTSGWVPGGLTSCPAGFSMVGASGDIGTFCIDTNQRAGKSFLAAQDECMDLSLSGKQAFLCGHVEWYKACRKSASASPVLVGMTGDYEWVAEFNNSGIAIVAGQSACSSLYDNAVSSTYPFRCCVR